MYVYAYAYLCMYVVKYTTAYISTARLIYYFYIFDTSLAIVTAFFVILWPHYVVSYKIY